MAFTARYDGTCPDCQLEITAGVDMLVKYDDEYIHEECAERARAVAQRRTKPAGQATGNAAGASFFGSRPTANPAPSSPNDAALTFFATPAFTSPNYVTKEEEVEAKVERDRHDRPLIIQPDGGTRPYNRASSYGGQLEDKTNIEKWKLRQTVRGVAIALIAGKQPGFLDGVPERLFDPWEDQDGDKGDKKKLDSLAERAQDMAGSNLKSQLGTDIHYATELIDLGESLKDGLKDFEPRRRALLKERADAYWKKTTEMGLKWDSVETFGVQDELEVAGTWDRRGYVPWWPEHRQVIGDVKTSGTMDYAGIGFGVQLATYSRMCAYDIATGARTPHEDMNEEWALIIHVGREEGSPVELYPVNIAWGWKKARLAREIITTRREGGAKGTNAVVRLLDEREAFIRSQPTRADLLENRAYIMTMPEHLRKLADQVYDRLPA